MKLRTHFAVLVGVIAVPALLLALALVVLVERQERAFVESGLQETARALAVAIDRELQASVRALGTLATSAALDTTDLRAFYAQALRAREANPRWLTVMLVDQSGRQLLNLLRPYGETLPPPTELNDVLNVARTGQPGVSNMFTGPFSGENVIVIAVPVTRGADRRYVLAAGVMAESLNELLAQRASSSVSIAAIRDRKGVLVARNREQHRFVGQPPTRDFAEKLERVRRGGASVFEARSLDGVLVYTAVSIVPLSQFVAVVAEPVAAVAVQSHRRLLAIGVVVIVAGALLISSLLARRVTEPIEALSRVAKQLARDEPITGPAVSSVDEVSEVHGAMAQASTELRERAADRERRIAAEAARAEAEKRTDSLERLAREKDEFLATLSHELRTPLTSIVGWAKMLRDGKLDADTARRGLEVIARNAGNQTRLISDLLDVSRIISGKMTLAVERVDLCPLIHSIIDSFRPTLQEKPMTLIPIFRDQGGLVMGDPQRLQQIIWNLVSNAVKFTPQGGRIEVALTDAEGYARLTVSDNGKGISRELLPHIFERFRQADSSITRPQGGLGLGLTIVRHLVELHGGTVTAESDGPETGASFTITLPLARDQGRFAASVPTTIAEPDALRPNFLSGIRVLVVDDDADTCEFLATVLTGAGAVTSIATSAERARDVLDKQCPEVLVCDIAMPGESGYEFLTELRARASDRSAIPAIALTAYARDEDREHALKRGFQIYLAKPVDARDLIGAVERLAHRPPVA